MHLGKRLLAGPRRHHEHGSGGHVVRPRLYEFTAAVGFLGRRRAGFDHVVAASGMREGDRVLDVGCGTGYLTRRAARAVGPTGHVIGVDPSQPVVDYAKRAAPPNCTFHVTGGESLPEPDASVDVVVSSLAIHHIPPEHRPAALSEIHRVLRPGGRLLIAEFRPPTNRLTGALFGPAMRHGIVGELNGLVTGAGLEVTGSGDRGPWPHLLHYLRARRPSG